MIDYIFLDYIRIALLGGLLGTAAMTGVMYLIDQSGVANCDMVRAVGSLITKSMDNAFGVGVVVHFASGVFFSIIYALIMDFISVSGFGMAIGYGAALGFFHGAVVNFALVVLVAEHHPIEKFQQVGFSVALGHWVGHIVYGLVVGVIVGATIA